ncbi:hypothetical protein SELMODRAFT_422444 [Selaginella moellendorffii]|uniref:Uncharacterized protein n=1 Tax=Selaginella moellendorffii TaxID=88036 RepID=D8SIF1_SELML|nr:hypothetical protein SELMODRAFT_422444 [Selaginella moellendorffii]
MHKQAPEGPRLQWELLCVTVKHHPKRRLMEMNDNTAAQEEDGLQCPQDEDGLQCNETAIAGNGQEDGLLCNETLPDYKDDDDEKLWDLLLDAGFECTSESGDHLKAQEEASEQENGSSASSQLRPAISEDHDEEKRQGRCHVVSVHDLTTLK